MTFEEFYKQWKGEKNVGNTEANKGQCVGLVSLWMDNYGIEHVWGDAKDLFNNAKDEDFTKILNTPTAIPQEGDIIIWQGEFNGGAGHTGIATSKSDINKFEVFEQNDPIGSTPHLKTYSYAYVIGWLRPKYGVIVSVVTSHDDDLTKMLNWDNLVDRLNSENFTTVKLDKLDKSGSKIIFDQIENLLGQISQKNKSLAAVEAEREALRAERDKALQDADALRHNGGGNNTGVGNTVGTGAIHDIQHDSSNDGSSLSDSKTFAKTLWAHFVRWFW